MSGSAEEQPSGYGQAPCDSKRGVLLNAACLEQARDESESLSERADTIDGAVHDL